MHRARLCDGARDCADGSDEAAAECGAAAGPEDGECGAGYLTCADNTCVDTRRRCDGHR